MAWVLILTTTAALVVLWIGWLGYIGKLKPNRFVGIVHQTVRQFPVAGADRLALRALIGKGFAAARLEVLAAVGIGFQIQHVAVDQPEHHALGIDAGTAEHGTGAHAPEGGKEVLHKGGEIATRGHGGER